MEFLKNIRHEIRKLTSFFSLLRSFNFSFVLLAVTVNLFYGFLVVSVVIEGFVLHPVSILVQHWSLQLSRVQEVIVCLSLVS